jgi:MFS transporter, FHS family, glucose/mannose:H+ symporter
LPITGKDRRHDSMNRRTVTAISLIGYYFTGFIPVMLAPALPFLIREFSLSLAEAGTALVARSAGSFIGVLMGGVLSDRFGRKPVLVAGCLLQGIMTGLIGISPNWLAITLFIGLNGLSVGLINPAFNAVVGEVHRERRGSAINILHGVYSIGAMIGPIVAGFLLASAYGWRYIYFGGCLVWILYSLALLPVTFPAVPKTAGRNMLQPAKKAAFWLNPILLLLFGISFIYNGTATSLVSWINTYLDEADFPLLLGAGMVSIFYLGLALGRFACGALAERLGYSRVILICAAGSLAFYPAAIYLAQPAAIALGVFLSGIFFSGLHPTGLAYANRIYPDIGGAMASFLSIAMNLGAMSVPWVIGFAADLAGFQKSFGLNVILLVILVVLAVVLTIREKHDSASQPAGAGFISSG